MLPADSILFKYHDKSSPVNFAQWDIMPYNVEIVSRSHFTLYIFGCQLLIYRFNSVLLFS